MKKILFALCFLTSCNLSSEGDFRSEGEKIVEEISFILSRVETHDELQSAVPRLKKKFNKLAALLLEVRSFREKNPDRSFSEEPLLESEALFRELARLYEIPGCREIVEQAQIEAVYKLTSRP